MSDLKPDDPTPDPEEGHPVDAVSETEAVPSKGTTFVDVVEAAKAAAETIDTSDGIQADELVDAAIGAANKVLSSSDEHPPLGHHVVSEIRRLLVPIVTAIIAAAAGGSFVEWRVGDAKAKAMLQIQSTLQDTKAQAIQEVEAKIRESEERAAELERIRTEVRKELLKTASWDGVGETLKVDEAAAVAKASPAYKNVMLRMDPPGSIDLTLAELVRLEAQQIKAQTQLQVQTQDQVQEGR